MEINFDELAGRGPYADEPGPASILRLIHEDECAPVKR